MPLIVTNPLNPSSSDVRVGEQRYEYPDGLDLRPGSKLNVSSRPAPSDQAAPGEPRSKAGSSMPAVRERGLRVRPSWPGRQMSAQADS